MLYAVIMAGGIGSRFWPQSRQARPKQFLNVFGDATLIQNTLGRLQGLVPVERCYVVTHERYVAQTQEQLPALPPENVLAEPISRNTAPCIAFAAIKLLAEDPDATMMVLPADHLIQNVRQFHEVLRVAAEKAQEPGALVTIGIKPTHPETGYGYIQYDPTLTQDHDQLQAYPVRTFAEKPDVATAERFLDSGDFLWNSGIFAWRADSIQDALGTHCPDVSRAFEHVPEAIDTAEEEAAIERAYDRSPKVSIDIGVMEKADNVWVVPGSFGWSDVGDWRAVYTLAQKDTAGNATEGNVIMHNTARSFAHSEGDRLLALVGLQDVIVIGTDDAVLVCHRSAAQQVKNVVDYLRMNGMNEFT